MNETIDQSRWYNGEYMTPEHPDAFKDHIKKEDPRKLYPKYFGHPLQECLKCHGYGGWNLLLNQYMNNEPPTCHFRAMCSNCNGYGWTSLEDHVHTWGSEKNIGRCLHEYTCGICGKKQVVDSSD